MVKEVLSLKNISKQYPGVLALDAVNLSFDRGKIHGIVGENGAGKSTLIKIMTGAVKKSKGQVTYKGRVLEGKLIENMTAGIHAVYQEFNLFPAMSVVENIYFGHELTQGIGLDKKAMKAGASQVLKRLGVDLSLTSLVRDIGTGNQQIVEIAKALSRNVEVLILDEPTAALTEKESDRLFKIIKDLKASGVSVIYISHKLDEIFKVCDDVAVFRDGQLIDKRVTQAWTQEGLVQAMVGRQIQNHFIKNLGYSQNQVVLEAKNLCTRHINDLSFKLQKGEVLGIAGLMSSGRTEIANAIFGLDKIYCGHLELKGKRVKIKSPQQALKHGISFITEDRKQLGLILNMSIKDNSSYAALNRWSDWGYIHRSAEKTSVEGMLKELDTRYHDLKAKVKNLSGGNQQKIVIAKSLLTQSDIIIFDEPTRGIDIGAKEEVYKIILDLVKMGKSIILISSEMPEILSLSDRILVMSGGKKVSEYGKGQATSAKIFVDSSSLLKERNHGK